VRLYHEIPLKKVAGPLIITADRMTNESSLAPQLKWLDNTFNVTEDFVTNPRICYLEVRIRTQMSRIRNSGILSSILQV
jgi:hypothetical protein